MKFGYMGKILKVDLSTRLIREEIMPDHVYEKYLSGMGLAACILYDRIPAGADPLGPENIIGFVSGLLTGTGSLFAGRWMVVGKSPLTGGGGRQTAAAVKDPFGIACPIVKRSLWERPQFDITTCMSCRICIDACPVHCLDLSEAANHGDPHGRPYMANAKTCIGCGFCARECPVEAIAMTASQS
jgi:NAD-dependent dihydropyrimidine dehydrogenase PreA subunit